MNKQWQQSNPAKSILKIDLTGKLCLKQRQHDAKKFNSGLSPISAQWLAGRTDYKQGLTKKIATRKYGSN
ncbi:hypothetical protein [Sunxiuqinia elliptica]|uniref:Uncharacterized protein n=1 Tax=Sunxiuqinia elliptica TaxID=655355 RepID=A0A4R6H8Z9_9BACT|nr:hypothetical protein [Sunxiuqinia elliptica]TDO04096.1 hypothetical protein DET52_102437 [Sunxiuqinia elliptica]TDO62378.1 hypothetical protein DET65_2114 [Sunxiuqinia elliptica]